MVYAFFSLVAVNEFAVSVTVPVVGRLPPASVFGVLLAVETGVALLTMVPVARLAERVGLKPVVALGFAVYAVFPAMLVSAPTDAVRLAGVTVPAAAVLVAPFVFSGLRFAGLPAHEAPIVGPAETGAGGRVTGSYYLVRNVVVVPGGLLGGSLYGRSPPASFLLAPLVGLVGTGYFVVRGEEFEAYA